MIHVEVRDIAAADRLIEALYVAAGQCPGTTQATEWQGLAADLETGLDRLPPQHPTAIGDNAADRAPGYRPQVRHDTPEAKLAALAQPAEDGHLTWPGPVTCRGLPLLTLGGRHFTAARVAFRVHYGREPIGQVLPACGLRTCLAGDHLDDRPARERLAAAMAALEG